MPDPTALLTVSSATRLALPSHVSLQSLGEEDGGVLLKIDTGEMYTVNDTTLSFLQELDGERSVADIAGRMVHVFDVEPDMVLADLIEVANGLAAEFLVVVAP